MQRERMKLVVSLSDMGFSNHQHRMSMMRLNRVDVHGGMANHATQIMPFHRPAFAGLADGIFLIRKAVYHRNSL
jgi:hypothetical protein